jgi:hypothetical protein
MTNKTYKFVTILMVMLLVLGLALVACKAPAEPVTPPAAPAEEAPPPAAPAEEAPPPAAPAVEAPPPAAPPAATSYPALTYTNDKYGFSLQYPKDWVARPELVTVPQHLAAFGVSAFVPGVVFYAFDADAPESADWIVSSFKATGNVDPKVKSDIKEETISGSKAYSYMANYISATGYNVLSYCIDVDRGDKRIRVNIFTIDEFAPYDETLASEIAHTLRF